VILQRRRCHELKIAPASFKDHFFRVRQSRGAVCNVTVTVTVHRSDGQLRLFHFIQRLASGGGCTCLKLRQRSARYCQFAHRYVDAMVKNRQRIDDLIDVLVLIRWMYPNAREHEVKVVEVTV
jgi:hypothetical protein